MDYSSSSLANGGVHASKTGSSSELYDEATPAFTNEATNPTSGRCIPSGEETDAASHLDDFSEHGRPKSEQAEERSSSAYGATKDDEQPNVARGEPSDDEDEVDDQYAALEARVKKAPKRLDQFTKYVHLMEDRVRYLEETLRKLEPEKPNILAEADQTNVATSNRVQPISELKYMRWGHFKNKYLGDREYAIEVLVGETKYWYQEQSETKLWEKKSQNDQVTNAGSESWTQTDVEQQKELPERIRINSSSIMTILSNIFSTSISEPVIFLRPYKLLVYYDSEIRQAFHRLESKWGRHNSVFSPGSDHKGETSKTISDQINPIVDTPEQSTTIAGSADSTQDNEFSAPANEQSSAVTTRDAPDDLADSLEAFRDLKCLIDFMDRHIAPVVEQLQSGARKCVRFNELWILFKPGELIYAPKKMDQQPSVGAGSSSSHQDRYQTLFKVLTVDGGRARLGPDPEKGHNNEDPPPLKDRVNPFKVYCYYVDFDGRNFSPAGHTFVIYPYEGERAITSLEAHPLRFAENHMTIRDELKLRGHKFKSVLNGKHMLYVGSTYTSDPNGGVEDAPKRTEYVNSEVIVDFAEADKLGSKWIYPAGLNWINRQIVATQFPDEFTETYYKNVWKDNRHKDYDRSFNETFFRDDNIDIRSSRVLVSSDPFLKAVGEMEAGFVHTTCDAVGDEETILLPSRVISYVLRDRKWAMLNVQNLRPIMSNSDGFKDLTLPSGHKEMVQALVRSHSMRRDGNATIKDAIEYDVVRGKGRGLIILLHGVPGVGKTSTAECIAQSTRKPLFPITCGDLGLTPKEVEESLQSVFQLAQAWDCVLLLDEADIFLAQRTKTDLKRNALVSVFLRVLEYYTGILFLTTNRVGAFDEAFKSRIHISLYYPELAKSQSKKIWEMNLERTKKIDLERTKTQTMPSLIVHDEEIKTYSEIHWMENQNGVGKWNGRQIRNAFQTASALALYEAHKENVKRLTEDPDAEVTAPHLRRKHFEKVAKATLQFDQYMVDTLGKDDAEAAHSRGDRTDQFQPQPQPQPRSSSRLQPPSAPQQYAASDQHLYMDVPPTPPPAMAHARPQPSAKPRYSQSPSPAPFVEQTEFIGYRTQTARRGRARQVDSDFDDEDEYE